VRRPTTPDDQLYSEEQIVNPSRSPSVVLDAEECFAASEFAADDVLPHALEAFAREDTFRKAMQMEAENPEERVA
jgi:hypothetical protein